MVQRHDSWPPTRRSGFDSRSALEANVDYDALEEALRKFAGIKLPTICAGRTDAGVHATYQVVHLDTGLERPLQSWVRGVNGFLPRSVAVRWSATVSEAFHARYGALARRYDYWLLNDPVRRPLAGAARRLGLPPARRGAHAQRRGASS